MTLTGAEMWLCDGASQPITKLKFYIKIWWLIRV